MNLQYSTHTRMLSVVVTHTLYMQLGAGSDFTACPLANAALNAALKRRHLYRNVVH